MKAKIIYISAFLAAFLITTGAVVKLNSTYLDIFKFDFRPIPPAPQKHLFNDTTKVTFAELKNYLFGDFKQDVFDSLKTYLTPPTKDTVYNTAFRDSSLIDSVRNLEAAIKTMNAQFTKNQTKQEQQVTEAKQDAKADSTYTLWTKKTAKLYESMDPQKAAKIIQSYSDNVARDIIYSMRQKQAAEVLSELNPETANRITRAK